MYGVMGEDDSDAETLKVLVRRLAIAPNLSVRKKGYGSCGEMLRKGASQLRLFLSLGCTRFIICYDSDGDDPQKRRAEVLEKIIVPAEFTAYSSGMCMRGTSRCGCILVPVQEIEAWILADTAAISKVFTSWHPSPIKEQPETIASPKEYLERLSEKSNKKPRYHHATHNKTVASHLNLGLVRERCPSFGILVDYVLN